MNRSAQLSSKMNVHWMSLRVLARLLGLLLLGLATACSNNGGATAPPPDDGGVAANAAFEAEIQRRSQIMAHQASLWDCPTQKNLVLYQNQNTQGADFSIYERFEVCRSNERPNEFRFTGATRWSKVCFYPYNVTGNQMAQAGQAKCFSVSSVDAKVVPFESTEINYMVAVNQNATAAFEACFRQAPASTSGHVPTCPPTSRGWIY